jgi:pSer/pThr/pTyr-binding forkhead associated (FHA) protein
VDGQVLVFPLAKARVTIGRDPSNDIVLSDNDVSRWHALISRENHHLAVRDMQSTNGVFVNHVRIHDPKELRVGDLLVIGSNLFAVALDDVTEDYSATTPALHVADELSLSASSLEPFHPPGSFDQTIVRDKKELLQGAIAKKQQVARFPRLLLQSDALGEYCYLLAVPLFRIGRAPDCHLRLPDRRISHHHAEIRVRPEGNMLIDLGSDHGLAVNGRRVHECRLTDGDVIELPAARLLYRHEEGLRGKVSEFLKNLFR